MSDTIDRIGLKFFGAIAASISHEIKNHMAIINEQAGLLEDLIHMAERGAEIDAGRLKRLAASVKSQVAQTDDIIRNMNRFAHAVSPHGQPTDLNDLLKLLTELCKRIADVQGVQVRLQPAPTAVNVPTSPFDLMNLIWLCLDKAMRSPAKGHELVLECEKTSRGASLRLKLDGSPDGLVTEAAAALADALKAEIICDSARKEIVISLPGNIKTGGVPAASPQ